MTERAVLDAFFTPTSRMQSTLAILCDSHAVPPTDPVTSTVLTMISCPVHVQLTALGWQPFKGKELTMPFQRMTSEQKEAIKALLTDERRQPQWCMYEHALVFRRKDEADEGGAAGREPIPTHLCALDVLEAMCSTILHTNTYADKRYRVAVCNILLQRVQAAFPVDKTTLKRLNQNLFPPPAPSAQPPNEEEVPCRSPTTL